MIPLKDIVGKTLNVGDQIAYPGRSGSAMWMNRGTILEIIREIDEYGRSYSTLKVERLSGKIVTLYCLDRIVYTYQET